MSSTGRSVLLTDGQIADAIPSGIPISVEMPIATAISASVVIALGHICEMPFTPPLGIWRTPNDATIAAAKTAVRHRPTSQATSVERPSTPTQVIQWSALMTSFVVPLRKLPKPPTIVFRKKFDDWLFVTQLSRRSNQLGTPSTQFVGKPLWRPLAAAPAAQIAT